MAAGLKLFHKEIRKIFPAQALVAPRRMAHGDHRHEFQSFRRFQEFPHFITPIENLPQPYRPESQGMGCQEHILEACPNRLVVLHLVVHGLLVAENGKRGRCPLDDVPVPGALSQRLKPGLQMR